MIRRIYFRTQWLHRWRSAHLKLSGLLQPNRTQCRIAGMEWGKNEELPSEDRTPLLPLPPPPPPPPQCPWAVTQDSCRHAAFWPKGEWSEVISSWTDSERHADISPTLYKDPAMEMNKDRHLQLNGESWGHEIKSATLCFVSIEHFTLKGTKTWCRRELQSWD